DRGERLPGIHSAGRIVRIHDDDGTSAFGHQRFDFARVRDERTRRVAGIMYRTPAVQIYRRAPQWVVRTRHQDLIAAIQQCTEREVDQLADAIADEDLFGSDSPYAAFLLLHDHRFARGEDSLLVHIAFAVAQVLDHGQSHRFRRAKTECKG